MKRAAVAALLACIDLISIANAQVVISDGKQRATAWMFCDVRPRSERRDLSYYYSPIFPKDHNTESSMMSALWPFWENGGEANGYMIYDAPNCSQWDSQADAESARNQFKSEYKDSRQIGLEVLVERQRAAAEAAEQAKLDQETAVEMARLGAHRAEEAARLVQMRNAADRARKRICPLGPNAGISCQ